MKYSMKNPFKRRSNQYHEFVEQVACLSLWIETDTYKEEGNAGQSGLDYLIDQDQALERLIVKARQILRGK